MIIGRGSIAQVIPDREGFVFYAKGNSNRFALTAQSIYDEELDILEQADKIRSEMFVYISGLNIYYKGERSDYTKHKMKMESIVKRRFINYCIFRLGSITWGDNPNTLVNSLRAQVASGSEVNPLPVHRYIHTKEELAHWFGMIPGSGQHEMNVTGQITWVPDLVERIKRGEI